MLEREHDALAEWQHKRKYEDDDIPDLKKKRHSDAEQLSLSGHCGQPGGAITHQRADSLFGHRGKCHQLVHIGRRHTEASDHIWHVQPHVDAQAVEGLAYQGILAECGCAPEAAATVGTSKYAYGAWGFSVSKTCTCG